MSCTLFGSLFHGVSREKPYRFERASIKALPQLFGSSNFQPAVVIAPSLIEASGFCTQRSGSTFVWEPSPEHSGHAPNGLLNENILGESSSTLMPQSGHESFCEKRTSDFSYVLSPSSPSTGTCISQSRRPSASFSAVSAESFRRDLDSSRITNLSITTSRSCFLFLSIEISSSSSS